MDWIDTERSELPIRQRLKGRVAGVVHIV
eukprot:SAG11_NODE_10790_length_805_cov_1.317280_1_plen_28_part_10